MKKMVLLVLCLFLLPLSALSESSYYGSVVCRKSRAILAPYGGIAENVAVEKGQFVHSGDVLCEIRSTGIYAPVDGEISVLFGRAGDSIEDLKSRYGGVLAITPKHTKMISANIQRAAKNADISPCIGQKLTLVGSRKTSPGTGRILSMTTEEETILTVEILSGDFFLNESVTLYVDKSCAADTKLGSGTVYPASPILLSGEGSLLKLHVKEGTQVKRGDLLYESVSGSLAGLKAVDSTLLSDADGVVASCEVTEGIQIEQNALLLTLYPRDAWQISVTVSETDLANLAIGQKVNLEFAGNGHTCEGTIATIACLPVETEENSSSLSYAQYQMLIDFDADDDCRIGMLVMAEIP